MLVLVTGNNLTLLDDLVRRFLVIRIDPRMEKPYERSFDIDPVAHVREHRMQIIAAALTLIRGQLTSNDQSVRSKLGSFEDWSRLVGDTVRWVSKHLDESFGDPVDTINRSLGRDPDTEDLLELLRALHALFGDEWFLAKDLSRLLSFGTLGISIKPRDAATRNEAVETIQYIFKAMLGDKHPSPRTLGRVLQNKIDRVADGLVVRRGPKVQGTVRWRVERLKA